MEDLNMEDLNIRVTSAILKAENTLLDAIVAWKEVAAANAAIVRNSDIDAFEHNIAKRSAILARRITQALETLYKRTKLSKQATGATLGRPPTGITQSATAKLLDVTRARVNHLCRDGILQTLSDRTIAAESLRTYILKRVTRQNLALKNGGRQ